jgi:hypothetical protein
MPWIPEVERVLHSRKFEQTTHSCQQLGDCDDVQDVEDCSALLQHYNMSSSRRHIYIYRLTIAYNDYIKMQVTEPQASIQLSKTHVIYSGGIDTTRQSLSEQTATT